MADPRNSGKNLDPGDKIYLCRRKILILSHQLTANDQPTTNQKNHDYE